MAATSFMKLEKIPYRLEGAGLVLDAYDPRDDVRVRQLFEAIGRSRDHLRSFMPWADQHRAIEETRAWIRDARSKFERMTDFLYAMLGPDGRFVGGAGMHVRGEPVPTSIEIGYWLAVDATGHGFARKATLLLARAAFELANAERVVIRADVENVRSRRIPEVLGFTLEGVARRSLLIRETFRDAAIYSMVRGEEARLQAG